MSNRQYSTEDYRKKIQLILDLAYKKPKCKRSSNDSRVGVKQEIESSSEKSYKLQSTRKSTPHPKASKSTFSVTTAKGPTLFYTSDNKIKSPSKGRTGKNEDDIWFPSPSSAPHKQKKQAKKEEKRSFKNSTVNFPGRCGKDKPALKRQATPYYPVSKKIKKNVCDDVRQTLFQSSDSESSDVPKSSHFRVAKKFRLSNNDVVRKKLYKQKKKRHLDSDSEICTDMNVTELICDNKKRQTTLSSKAVFLSDEESDSKDSLTLEELNVSNFDCTNSIVERDIKSEEDSSEENIPESLGSDTCEEDVTLPSVINKNINNFDQDSEEVGQANFYAIEEALLIFLKQNSKLYFHGLISVKVLYGAVEVLGYTLTSSSNTTEIFSPRGSSFLFFETKDANNAAVVHNGLPDKLCNLGLERDVVKELCQNLRAGSAVILCSKIDKAEIEFMKRHISQQLFPQCESRMPQCVFQTKADNWDVLINNSDWDLLLRSVEAASKMLICGGKSVGKSTMLRYMINKLLLQHPKVLVIDLDPGQPEFTISGCVAATIVTQPVFGPNYSHLRKPHRCLFVPNINIAYQPDSYLNNVEELVESCADLPVMPTLINYMGYTRGFGLDIFSAVVAYTQPKTVIQIESSSTSRNFRKRLGYELIRNMSKTLAPTIDHISPFDILTISSMADENERWHLQPRQIREMSVLTYLGKMLPKDVWSITDPAVPVYVVDMSEIKLLCNGKIVIPAVVNGNLVALCSLNTSNSFTCFGWGVVRGINLIANELFLLTPVTPNELECVDHLILGPVSLPPSLYMTSDNNVGLAPYISEGVLTTLGQIPKRTHLPAKGNRN